MKSNDLVYLAMLLFLVLLIDWFAGEKSAFYGIIGEPTTILYALLVLISIDYLTGVISAAVHGRLNSYVGFVGVSRKIIILALCILSHQIDVIVGTGYVIRDATLIYYAGVESLSILENAGKIGVPIPPVLTNAISVLKGRA